MHRLISPLTRRSATLCFAALVAGCGGGESTGLGDIHGGGTTQTQSASTGGTTGTGGIGGATTGSAASNSGGSGGEDWSSTSSLGTGGANGSTGSSASDGAGGAGGSLPSAASSSSGGIDACVADSTVAERLPLDMYIMLDQSGSMLGDRWNKVTSALKTFVAQDDAKGIGVGIQYFGLGGACTASTYAKPEVAIAPLPGVQQEIINSINAHKPSGGTPTLPALQGAIQYASSHSVANPTHTVITVLATDGQPSGCSSTVANVKQAAANGLNATPSILTFVIGVGPSTGNLNGVAASGGTSKALMVEDQNAEEQFLKAMNDIRGKALGCTYLIPTPSEGTLDYTKVNVEYTPGNGDPKEILTKVPNAAACPPNGDAWHYNDEQNPSTILLCPSTCARASADAAGKVDLALGCKTIHE